MSVCNGCDEVSAVRLHVHVGCGYEELGFSLSCYAKQTMMMCIKWRHAVRLHVHVGCGYEELGFNLSSPVLFWSCWQSLLLQLFLLELLPTHGLGRNLLATL